MTATARPGLPLPAEAESWSRERWVLHRGDALSVLRSLSDASVDAIVTDPPYSSGGFTRGDRTAMSRIAGRVDATMTRALEYLIALAAASSLLWWGGYALAKRAVGSGHSHRAAAHG